MKNLLQNFKAWRIGRTPYSVGRLIGIAAQKPKRSLRPKEFDPTLFARILNLACRFWYRTWKIILPIIVATIVALFIHFDSKTDTKAKQKKDGVPSVQTGKQ